MTNSQSASSGCFSHITRVLLCRGSLQTHPDDQTCIVSSTTEFNQLKRDVKVNEAKLQARASPGVVARLMGLDSLPDSNWVPKGTRTPDSVPRSRSVNFMDYLLELDLAQAQHRRVRTSVSFREVPVVFDKQNHDFLVVYMDDAEETKKVGSKVRKSEASHGEMKVKIEEKNAGENEDNGRGEAKKEKGRLRDDRRKVSNKQLSRFQSCEGAQVSPSNFASSPKIKKDVCRKTRSTSKTRISRVKPVDQKEALVESKFMKKMRNRRAIRVAESDSSSEVSDAVSVLSLSDISLHDENPLHDYANSLEKSSTRTANMGCPASHPRSILYFDDLERKGGKKKDCGSFENRGREFYTELVENLCRLTEEDIIESNWMVMNAFQSECFQYISAEFGQQILDLLLCQVIEELAEVQ